MTIGNSHPKYRRFRFDAGSLSLNFVATVRHRGAEPRDLLIAPEALPKWLHLAGLFHIDTTPSQNEYEEAVLLRESIHAAVQSIILNAQPESGDIARINLAAAFPLAVPQLHTNAASVAWETDNPVKACLAVIARDAITIMTGAERKRLKRCESGGCRMLFLDNSPSNRRRWCAMSICGNREKIRSHRQRKQLQSHDDQTGAKIRNCSKEAP